MSWKSSLGKAVSYSVRAHHLLCARHFQGYGYSPAFVRRMRRTLALWHGRPQSLLIIINDYDVWCRACPNQGTDNCTTAVARDNLVLKHLGLVPGTALTWAAAWELVGRKVDKNAAGRLCAGCPWLAGGYCRW
ncbi:DUF1284 domain-containing protein [Moorella sp. E306M]|uniref:DUF1284 domain-containing protein n=1 Tax=Moorella sp. E306M TaxID=2572683 RepID=UPI0010FFBAAE|nr:DUF1284 domain-containing protein [Moorella sp. E306M]GEA17998.1 hypothetical protein E306M_11340 [Moorella sp. E306M]